MLDGQEAFQISYSTALTVMSLLVPIFVLILAFLGVSGNVRIQWWRIVLAGFLSGGAISGMHYLADASIRNYSASYELPYLVGSVVISVLASLVALALFFVFENTWNSAWWKRLGCAVVLAGAVSGMHWCAAVGTRYTSIKNTNGKGVSRQDAMVIVICLVSLHSGNVGAYGREPVHADSEGIVYCCWYCHDRHGRLLRLGKTRLRQQVAASRPGCGRF